MAVIKISLPVILLDEALKFIARRYIDRKNFSIYHKRKCQTFVFFFSLSGGLKSKNVLDNVMSIFKNDLPPIDKLSNQQTAHLE